MVRIYCLTSIINENLFTTKSNNGTENGQVADIFNGDNTKAALEKLKNDSNSFVSYKLTEISIGHHFVGDEKVFLLLLFRKDLGLFVIKMIPGAVRFEEISNTVCEFSISTSTLFSNTIAFDLVVRIRCIKNTSVRGISEEEIKYYEKMESNIKDSSCNSHDLQEYAFEHYFFDLPLQSGQKVLRQKLADVRQVVELLCDEKNGSVENVDEKARYNQKAHCYQLTENSSRAEKRLSRKRSMSSTASVNSSEDTTADTSGLPSYLSKSRGRPVLYKNKEERKRARVEASKKYIEHKKVEYEKLKNELNTLEYVNQELIEKCKEMCVEYCRTESFQNMLLQKMNFETLMNERLKAEKFLSSPPSDYSRKEKMKTLVQRCRERQKAEREVVERKYEFFRKYNEELQKQLDSLRNVRPMIIDTKNICEVTNNETEDAEKFKLNEHSEVHAFEPPPSSYPNLSGKIQNSEKKTPELQLATLFPKHANIPTAPTTNFATLSNLQLQNVNLKEVCECFFEKLPPSLETLNLSNNKISFISKSISRMKNLKSINLSHNELNYIPWESLPPNIEHLNLSNSSIEKISTVNLPNLNILEIQNTKLFSLPIGFENLQKLQYLDLTQNYFTQNSNLEELLWNRLPSNISILKMCKNDLGRIPCSLRKMKFKHLSVNDCNLTNICSYFLNQSRKFDMVLEIGGNWDLETLPIIPQKIYQPSLTRADTRHSFSFNGLNLITDNESFINTSRFPTKDNQPIYTFEEYQETENSCCRCCAICGDLKEKTIKQLMVMDVNLCLSTNFANLQLNLFEHGKSVEVQNIVQQLKDKIKNNMHLLYGPGNWKTEVITGLCIKCIGYLTNKIAEATLNISINCNKIEKKDAEETSYISEMGGST